MKLPVTLLKFGVKALNEEENYVTRPVVEEYLSSNRWRSEKDAKMVMVSVTHIHRNDAGSEPGLGANDELFLRGVIVGCLEDSWISKDGKSWEGTINLFDNLEDYSENQKDMICQVLRLIKNGVSLQVSCCIAGEWDESDGKLEKLYSLQGVDFTMNPAFVGSMIHPNKDMED